MNAEAPTLHVAAMPFPSHQGTQAALCAMIDALRRAGRPTELLTYAHGCSTDVPPFPVLRSREPWRYQSLRSGPSAHKLLADAALGVSLLRARASLLPRLIVAHHVEAAALALPARASLFFAHTDLEAELPSYAPRSFGPLLAPLGRGLDLGLARSAGAVAAISPLLAERMRALLGARADKVHCVPPPWPVPAAIDAGERARARAELGVGDRRVLLYAGNLDRYQGWEPIVHALARMPDLILLVGTQSDAGPLWMEAERAAVSARVRVRAIDGEAARRFVHACADAVVVPRRAPGGLPIKLIDALARGVPCVVADNATAGLPLAGSVHGAGSGDAEAIAHAVSSLLAAPAQRAALSCAGPRYIAREHGDARFLARYDAACAAAIACGARA